MLTASVLDLTEWVLYNAFLFMILFYNTNNPAERVTFSEALLRGIASGYGLYMVEAKDIPVFSRQKIEKMSILPYDRVAYEVLFPFLENDVEEKELDEVVSLAYQEEIIVPKIEEVTGGVRILWLSTGPTYSFKDYAARFFGRMLDKILRRRGQRRLVIVATSGDTGGAVADALFGLKHVECLIFYPKGSVSEGQRRQMTTLQGNVYAFEVNGSFDICQSLAKKILADRQFALELFGDDQAFTSANSISVGRLLPQIVYPFYAYSRLDERTEIVTSIPSGNFGNMLGTVIAKRMGLPIRKIICAVNENREFPDFLETGRYVVRPCVRCPSSAMDVSHPSNLARLFELYGGRMVDRRDERGIVVEPGVVERMPDLVAMRREIFAYSVSIEEHYETIRRVYERFGIVLDPHGACAFRALEVFLEGRLESPSFVYETADPGKFPEIIREAIGITVPLPPLMEKQKEKEERIFHVESDPEETPFGPRLSEAQVMETKELMRGIFC